MSYATNLIKNNAEMFKDIIGTPRILEAFFNRYHDNLYNHKGFYLPVNFYHQSTIEWIPEDHVLLRVFPNSYSHTHLGRLEIDIVITDNCIIKEVLIHWMEIL